MSYNGSQRFRIGIIIESKWPIKQAIDYTKLAEQNGYQDAWVNDYIFDRDPFSILSILAENTSKIRLGTGVVNPYLRHPAMIASSIATVASIAPGRVVLGIGSSNNSMLKPIAITVESPIETCKQTIEVVRLLLGGKSVSYDGSKFKLDNAKLSFKPDVEIPIFLALATGKRMMQLCGEYADGTFLMEATEDFHSEVLKSVHDARQSSPSNRGTSFEAVANQLISVGKDRRHAIDSLKPVMASNLARKGPGVTMMGLELSTAEGYVKEPATIPDEFMQSFALCGTVDDCLDRIAILRKIGITQIAHRFPSQEQVRSVGEMLLPAISEQFWS